MNVLLVLVAFIANTWATSLLNNRIFCGHNAAPGQFPYLLSLQKLTKESEFFEYDEYEHICGGAIISPTWGLTAAHCLEIRADFLRVVVGITNLKEQDWEGQRVFLAKTVPHRDYEKGLISYNDIALLKFADPLKFGGLVEPILLPPAGSEPSSRNFLFSGWGHACKGHPDQLQYTEMDLFTNHEACLARKFFCAVGAHGSHGGGGDSGGPLVQNGELVGIYYGLPSVDLKGVDAFSKVSAFISFIEFYVKDLP